MEELTIVKPEEYFLQLFKKYGFDEKSLGWSKNKQKYRFKQVSNYIEDGDSVLDIGCGFGDFYDYLISRHTNNQYYGIDIIKEYVDIAISRFDGKYAHFSCARIDELPWDGGFDWVIECGLFGLRQFDDEGMYNYIDETVRKALDLCSKGISFNFLSDKVDYKTSGTDFHVSPERILSIAYKYSRRVIIDNSILPFEYSATIWKDDSFSKDTTVFSTVWEAIK